MVSASRAVRDDTDVGMLPNEIASLAMLVLCCRSSFLLLSLIVRHGLLPPLLHLYRGPLAAVYIMSTTILLSSTKSKHATKSLG